MSEKVLAVAAGHEITEGEVNDLIKNYPPEQQIYMSSPQAKQQVLEQIIAFHLFHQMAIDEKIPESKEYKEMIEKMRQKRRMIDPKFREWEANGTLLSILCF